MQKQINTQLTVIWIESNDKSSQQVVLNLLSSLDDYKKYYFQFLTETHQLWSITPRNVGVTKDIYVLATNKNLGNVIFVASEMNLKYFKTIFSPDTLYLLDSGALHDNSVSDESPHQHRFFVYGLMEQIHTLIILANASYSSNVSNL